MLDKKKHKIIIVVLYYIIYYTQVTNFHNKIFG